MPRPNYSDEEAKKERGREGKLRRRILYTNKEKIRERESLSLSLFSLVSLSLHTWS